MGRTQVAQRLARAVRVLRQRLEGDQGAPEILDPDSRHLEREAAEPAHNGPVVAIVVLCLDQQRDRERVVQVDRRQLRRRVWDRLAGDLRPRGLDEAITREIDLDAVDPFLDEILAGRGRGRTVVKVAG